MLTPNQLERAPQAYRRGYRDGYAAAPHANGEGLPYAFQREDYRDGYAAGANDRYWDQQPRPLTAVQERVQAVGQEALQDRWTRSRKVP